MPVRGDDSAENELKKRDGSAEKELQRREHSAENKSSSPRPNLRSWRKNETDKSEKWLHSSAELPPNSAGVSTSTPTHPLWNKIDVASSKKKQDEGREMEKKTCSQWDGNFEA